MEYNFTIWDRLPRISCCCMAFAREDLIHEAVQSYLLQDYSGETELVILNDYEEQDFVFNHQNVRIYNRKQRYPALAAKYADLIDLCKYEYIAPWPLDDISLPWRLSVSVERMNKAGPLLHLADDRKNFQYYGPGHWIVAKYNNGSVSHKIVDSFDHGATLYSRQAYEEGKHYDLKSSQCLGSQMDHKFRILGYWSFDRDMPIDNTFFIYRRFLDDKKFYPHALAAKAAGTNGINLKKAQEHYVKYARKGEIEINPHWKLDYDAFLS